MYSHVKILCFPILYGKKIFTPRNAPHRPTPPRFPPFLYGPAKENKSKVKQNENKNKVQSEENKKVEKLKQK